MFAVEHPFKKLKIDVCLHKDEIPLLGQDFSTMGLTTLTSSSNPGEVKTLSLELAISRS